MSWKILWVFSLLLLFPVHPISARTPATIIAFDQLVQPDHSIRLTVRLVTGGLSFTRRPISGERIEFVLDGRSLGQALTGGDGLAVKSFTPGRPGLYRFTVRLVDNPRYEAEADELIAACRKGSDPLLLVTLASLRTPANPPAVPFSPAPSAEAMTKASQTLALLSKRYQIVYLETGDESLRPGVKEWLDRQSFPSAPVFVWSLPGEAEPRMEGFVERLEGLRKTGWKNIPGGITRSAAEAEGLSRMKIKAIVMAEADDEIPLPKSARKVNEWKSVPAALK